MNEMVMQDTGISLISSINIDEISAIMQKINTFQTIVHQTLKKDHDYGLIPGVNKPSLFKPGGEKICMLFGLNPEYEFLAVTEDYAKEFFSYNMKCTLFKNGSPCAQGVGSCNSKEKKYRYINVDTIPEGYVGYSEQFDNGYGKTKFKIENNDTCSLVNTILKMAKKRAFVDAILQVASLSEVFTQDIEDMQEFTKQESAVSASGMTVEEAAKIKITFGKYKGKSLGDIYKSEKTYIDWLIKSDRTDTVIRAACQKIISGVNEHRQNKNQEQPAPSNQQAETDDVKPLWEMDEAYYNDQEDSEELSF